MQSEQFKQSLLTCISDLVHPNKPILLSEFCVREPQTIYSNADSRLLAIDAATAIPVPISRCFHTITVFSTVEATAEAAE